MRDGDLLAGRRLDQGGPGQVEGAALGHEQLVAQDRQVAAAGDAVAQDGRELRHAGGGEHGVVAEDAAEVVLVRKNFILHRKKHTGRIDQINQWKIIFESDPLRADKLLRRLGEESARFHGSVISDDHARDIGDVANAGDGTGRGNASPLFVHFVSGP